MRDLSLPFSQTHWKICLLQEVVEDFSDVHFSCVMVEGRVADSSMDGFSSNFFAILIYYLEVEDVGSGVVVGNAVDVNCTGGRVLLSSYPDSPF